MSNENPDERLERLLKTGFTKSLTFKYIKVKEDGKVYCTEVDFFASDHTCFTCKTNKYRVLRPERTGVMLTCAWCSTTTGPISKSEGDIRKEYEVSVDEAVAILRARNADKRDIGRVLKTRTATKQLRQHRKRPEIVG